MTVDNVGYFRIARNAAEKSKNPEHRIGAVICNKKPLSIGFNQWDKTNPRVKAYGTGRGKRLHAEMHACQGLTKAELEGSHIYVIRLTPAGSIGLAHPCEECLQFLASNGVRKVIYSVGKTCYGVIRWRAVNSKWGKSIS